MQDFTGVPSVVDLATMREAMAGMGGDPAKINPLAPAELAIDYSVIADVFGTADAFARNVESNTAATASAISFFVGGKPHSTTSRWSRLAPGSCTRSTSSTWPG